MDRNCPNDAIQLHLDFIYNTCHTDHVHSKMDIWRLEKTRENNKNISSFHGVMNIFKLLLRKILRNMKELI